MSSLTTPRPRNSPRRGTKSSPKSSSFVSALKNLALGWFAGTTNADEFGDEKDDSGKRRRVGAPDEVSEPLRSDGPGPAKRMRIRSPDREPSQPAHGYLDPPASSFSPQKLSIPSSSTMPNRQAPITSIYASYPDFNRNSPRLNSPQRHTIPRTMSLDPPQIPRPFSRDIAMRSITETNSFDRDVSMEASDSLIRRSFSATRDLSMPPLSSRPSFRMRSSLTPQPSAPPREVSEPPALTSLRSNPVFVHPPVNQVTEPKQMVVEATNTLGSLVDAQRSSRSPMRQRSLLFGSPAPEKKPPAPSTADKVIHDLDVYKTPLVPSRLRAHNSSGQLISGSHSNITDMFRRRESIVLMQEDASGKRKSKKERKGKEVNESKPYAGEGGMKKLLARRRKEAEDLLHKHKDDQERSRLEKEISLHKQKDHVVPVVPEKDWFDLARKSDKDDLPSASRGSSLRVGRNNSSRVHGPSVRPVRAPKPAFSAAFEEDDDDDNFGFSSQSKKDFDMLNEAAKKAPAFDVTGFSFAKETPAPVPTVDEDTNPEDRPIASLPFSLGTPSAKPSPTPTPAPSLFGITAQPPRSDESSTEATSVARKPTESAAEGALTSQPSFVSATPMPNFFASSPALVQTSATAPLVSISSPFTLVSTPTPPAAVAVASTTTLAAPLLTPSILTPSSLLPPAPIKDSSSPFWDGDKKKEAPKSGFFNLVEKEKENISTHAEPSNGVTASSASIFSIPNPATTSLFGSSNKEAEKPVFQLSEPFSFGGPTAPSIATGALFGKEKSDPLADSAVPSSAFGSSVPPSKAPTPIPSFAFAVSAAPTSAPTPATELGKSPFSAPAEAAKSLFGAAPTPATEQPKSLFGAPTESTKSLFGSSVEALKPLFGTGTSSDAPKPFDTIEAPKPTTSPFAFGLPSETPKTSTPFAFGAPPSTPPAVEVPKATGFSFGKPNPSTSTTSSGFSFPSASSTAPSTAPFSFGASARPVTPPRNDSQEEFKMDESPTRDLPANGSKAPEPRPTLNGTGFGFGNSSSTASIFGQPGKDSSSTPAPFSFGQSAVGSSSLFSGNKQEDPKPFGSGFGQTQTTAPTSNPFAFGGNDTAKTTSDSRPSTAGGGGGFSFASPTAATSSSGFSFGQTAASSNSNPFGQSPSNSAPSSPSTFAQPGGAFSFGTPAPAPAPSFSFGGSQPASPATNTSALPQNGATPAFGATASSFGSGAQTASSFGTPPAPSGGALFTMGAAPAPGPRPMKKLPSRRGSNLAKR